MYWLATSQICVRLVETTVDVNCTFSDRGGNILKLSQKNTETHSGLQPPFIPQGQILVFALCL